MSVLSTVQAACESHVIELKEQVISEALECLRLVFMLVSEAMHGHTENSDYFQVSWLICLSVYLSL
jgi:hypothetical protein